MNRINVATQQFFPSEMIFQMPILTLTHRIGHLSYSPSLRAVSEDTAEYRHRFAVCCMEQPNAVVLSVCSADCTHPAAHRDLWESALRRCVPCSSEGGHTGVLEPYVRLFQSHAYMCIGT